MEQSQSNNSSFHKLKARLQSLRAQQIPVPATKLLHILAPFLLHLSKQTQDSLTTQTTHYLMEKWYAIQPKLNAEILSEYPSDHFHSYCFNCLRRRIGSVSNMPSTCEHCRALPNLRLYFFADFLHYRYQIHPIWVEKVFCDYLEARFQRVNIS